MIKANAYKILGISTETNTKEIKKAYFSLIKKYPPEKNPERFKQIRQAYELLLEITIKNKTEQNKILKYSVGNLNFSELDSYIAIAEDLLFNLDAVINQATFIDIGKNDKLFII